MECVPEPLRGSAFSKEVIRHSSSSHVSTPTLSSETEVVHIRRTSQNESTIKTVIGARRLYGILVLADEAYPMTATTACTLNTKQNCSQAV